MKKLLTLCLALVATTSLWASNTITYTATEKLRGYASSSTSYSLDVGKTTFGPAITSHTFKDGIGTITCKGEITTIGGLAFCNCTGLTSIIIPNSVTTIGNSAFFGCTSLTSVTIPNSVTSIGGSAFELCSGLTSVTIPNSVTSIGDKAFYECTHLTSVTIPNSVIMIGSSAFGKCSHITIVTIGNSVESIGMSAFSGCDIVKTYYNGTIADWCKIEFSGGGANPMSQSGNLYVDNKVINDLIIPEGIEHIKNYAFIYNHFKSITIPSSVLTIGEHAFSSSAGEVIFKEDSKLTTIADRAFTGSEMKSISIPNSVKTIGEWVFADCRSLASVKIGNSLEAIEINTFNGCWVLNSFFVAPENSHFTSMDGVLFNNLQTTLVKYPQGNTRSSYNIPSSVITLESRAFEDCSYLTSITIGNSITTIEEGAFDNCSGLTSVTIGNSVTTIGKEAFIKCKGIKLITSYASIPPFCEEDCFYEVPKNIPVYVPVHSLEDYQTSKYWKDFKKLQGNPNDYGNVTCIAENGTISGGGKYIKGESCCLFVTPNYGYNFTQWSDGSTENPRTVIVTQDTTFTAEFAKNIYTISTQAENGSVIGAGNYEYLTTVQLTAIPNEGYEFVNWSNGITDNPYTFIVEQNIELTANFKKIETGWQDIHNGINATKYFHNGNLIIERNGMKYTATGQKVR